MKASLLSLLLLSLVACSHVKKTTTSYRLLETNANWISQIHEKQNLEPRKISRSAPVIYKDSLIAGGASGGLASFNRKSGKLNWRFPVKEGVEASLVLFNRDQVIFGAKDGYIYSISAEDGELNWKFFAKAEILSTPSIDGTDLYFLSGANVLYKLDANTGKQKWVYSRVQRSLFSVRGGAEVLVNGGRVYAGFSDGFLVALNQSSGQLIWERRLATEQRFGDVDNSPITDGKLVISASFDGSMYAFNVDGSLAWRTDIGVFSKATLLGNRLLASSSDAKLWVLDKNTGKKIKSYQLGSIGSSVLVKDNLWIVSEAVGSLRVIDSVKEDFVASYVPGKGSMSTPVFDDNYKQIYLNSNAGNVHAISLRYKDKRLLWPWEAR